MVMGHRCIVACLYDTSLHACIAYQCMLACIACLTHCYMLASLAYVFGTQCVLSYTIWLCTVQSYRSILTIVILLMVAHPTPLLYSYRHVCGIGLPRSVCLLKIDTRNCSATCITNVQPNHVGSIYHLREVGFVSMSVWPHRCTSLW